MSRVILKIKTRTRGKVWNGQDYYASSKFWRITTSAQQFQYRWYRNCKETVWTRPDTYSSDLEDEVCKLREETLSANDQVLKHLLFAYEGPQGPGQNGSSGKTSASKLPRPDRFAWSSVQPSLVALIDVPSATQSGVWACVSISIHAIPTVSVFFFKERLRPNRSYIFGNALWSSGKSMVNSCFSSRNKKQ